MIAAEGVLVLTIAVLNFSLGGIWYALLGKKWLLAWKLNEDQVNKKDPKPYLVAFIGSIWTTYGMMLMIKHIQPQSYSELFALSVGTWLFIVVGIGAKHYAFAMRSLSAFLIDYLLDLVSLILIGSLIYLYY